MANIYVMPQAMVCDRNGDSVFPNVDQLSYRGVEGHGSEKAFRYNGFEQSRSNNPNIYHTYQSDDYNRMEKLFTDGTLAVGDMFLLGIAAPELTEINDMWIRQCNSIAGLEMEFKIKDFMLADVPGTTIPVDFSNACDDATGRWEVNPVQKLRFDDAADALYNGENEVFWLVACVTALPEADQWFGACAESDLPCFQVRTHYTDSCLSPEGHTCAPLDTYEEWTAAIEALEDDLVIWNDIKCSKRTDCPPCKAPVAEG